MIDKFIEELKSELGKLNVDSADIVEQYEELYERYIDLGQSEFDIVCHFGEPSDIASNFAKTGEMTMPNMNAQLDFKMPAFLEEKHEEVIEPQKVEENIAPTTRAGLIFNDIFFVGLGLVVAIAGCIALLTVSILMTASSIVQLGACWKLATTGAKVGGFFIAIMALVASILFYIFIVWMVRAVIKFMKRYAKDHRENWNKAA